MSGIEQDLRAELDEANRRLGAVAALAGEWEKVSPSIRLDPQLVATDLRAVLGPVSGPPSGPGLGPVSGVVEGAGVVRLTADLARVVPCPHDCGWSGPLSRFHYHRGLCPVRADLPAGAVPENDSPVVGHEQEVRAEAVEWRVVHPHPDNLEPGGETWTEREPEGQALNYQRSGFAIQRRTVGEWADVPARASGSSAPVQGDGA